MWSSNLCLLVWLGGGSSAWGAENCHQALWGVWGEPEPQGCILGWGKAGGAMGQGFIVLLK